MSKELSTQERAIMAWVAEGLTNQQIATKMWLSPDTVKTHLANVRAKLVPYGERATRIQLVRLCRDRGEIP